MALTPADYSFRQLITGTSPSAPNSNQILLITEANIHADFWSNINNGGDALRVCEDSAGVNQLPLEVVLCNTTTEKLIAWTRKPSYTTSDRDVYLFAKTSGTKEGDATTYGSDNVWQDCSNAYLFDADTSATVAIDRTGDADGTASGFSSGDLTSNGRVFDNAADYIESATTFKLSTDYTVYANITSFTDPLRTAALFTLYTSNVLGSAVKQVIWMDTGGYRSRQDTSGGTNIIDFGSASTRSIAVVLDSGSTHKVYEDGVLNTTLSITGSPSTTNSDLAIGNRISSLALGHHTSDNLGIEATLKTFLIFPSALTGSYIASLDANQENSGTFWTQGTPDDPSGGSLEVTSATPTFSYSAINGDVDLTGSIDITGATPAFSYSSITADVDLTGTLDITGATTSYSYAALAGSVDLISILEIAGQTPTYSYSAISGQIDLTGLISVIGETPSFTLQSIDGVVSLLGTLSIEGGTPNYTYSAINALAMLSGTITARKNINIPFRNSSAVKVTKRNTSIKVKRF